MEDKRSNNGNWVVDDDVADYISISQPSVNKAECLMIADIKRSF